jgi:hypothetical protein
MLFVLMTTTLLSMRLKPIGKLGEDVYHPPTISHGNTQTNTLYQYYSLNCWNPSTKFSDILSPTELIRNPHPTWREWFCTLLES